MVLLMRIFGLLFEILAIIIQYYNDKYYDHQTIEKKVFGRRFY